ncbi:1,2-phenylacetyl-CoA epoxidase subunit PaaD [Streptomyces sp. Amel2xC10]|uniref:1,2-phenylacetyl-CoA epoxidase subunit PaaD n=1 Tax=Streptomyces sp. Amel2xC10 TaxID=1305826 RepID=UPI000A084B3D|nr:1,2-phenylacetyl-CoA epoxidase subunit PaaD [Streptomyces sp. Amel2xC10]SMF40820.1 ring-1,2-phenylacetyl-CoA epoxidase subunit PaaD [Streptomyces sp. Amel2xC10]
MTGRPLAVDEVRARIDAVPDPELPFVTLGQLGIVHAVFMASDGRMEVEFTPTFLGCPALAEIAAALAETLAACGHPDGRIRQVLTPAWSTDRITADGRRALAEHGIAPPGPTTAPRAVRIGLGAPCPNCGSRATRPHSPFGPTRCQSVLVCASCRETFPYLATV